MVLRLLSVSVLVAATLRDCGPVATMEMAVAVAVVAAVDFWFLVVGRGPGRSDLTVMAASPTALARHDGPGVLRLFPPRHTALARCDGDDGSDGGEFCRASRYIYFSRLDRSILSRENHDCILLIPSDPPPPPPLLIVTSHSGCMLHSERVSPLSLVLVIAIGQRCAAGTCRRIEETKNCEN